MSIGDAAFAALEAQGGGLVSPPILIEAAVPLELSGEAVRSRICTFLDGHSKEWALRPDLTLVVAQAEMAERRSGDLGETIRRYRGPVFRLPVVSGEPIEFEQIGIEKFGAESNVENDVWVFQSLVEASQACGMTSGQTCFGDLSLFPAFVQALGFPQDVTAGLKRAFRQEGGVRAYLSGQQKTRTGLAGRVAGMEREEIAAFVEDIYAITGMRPIGERSSDEIVERLFARSSIGRELTLSKEQSELLERLLALDVPFLEAPEALQSIAEEGALKSVLPTLERFAQRTLKLSEIAPAFTKSARFATRFGRRFTYYDGFVFEIARADVEASEQQPVVAGGRYDTLLSNLSGGDVNETAVGGIILPHRLPLTNGAPS